MVHVGGARHAAEVSLALVRQQGVMQLASSRRRRRGLLLLLLMMSVLLLLLSWRLEEVGSTVAEVELQLLGLNELQRAERGGGHSHVRHYAREVALAARVALRMLRIRAVDEVTW